MDHKRLCLPKAVVGWIHNYSRVNYVRLAKYNIEFDDLVQDGLACAYKCQQYYGKELDPPHFMRLVQQTFYHHIADIMRAKQGFDDSIKILDLKKRGTDYTEDDLRDQLSPPADTFQDVAHIISELPYHLRNAVELLINDPLQFRKAFRVKFDGTGETLSKRLAKLTGWPEHLDFETELRSYLWQRQRGLLSWKQSALKARIDRVIAKASNTEED
jgi:hypothetical protein